MAKYEFQFIFIFCLTIIGYGRLTTDMLTRFRGVWTPLLEHVAHPCCHSLVGDHEMTHLKLTCISSVIITGRRPSCKDILGKSWDYYK